MAFPIQLLGPGLWRARNSSERDAIAGNQGVEVGDLCLVDDDGLLHRCTAVLAQASTWEEHGASLATAVNLGSGAAVFKQDLDDALEFRTLVSSDASVAVAELSDELDVTLKLPLSSPDGASGEAFGAGASALGVDSTVLGAGASVPAGSADGGVALGAQATASGGIALGFKSENSIETVLAIGSAERRIDSIHLGWGEKSALAAASNVVFGASDPEGADLAGCNVTISGGRSTGLGKSGDIRFARSAPSSTPGTAVNPRAGGGEMARFDGATGNLGLGTTLPLERLHVDGRITCPGTGSDSEQFGVGSNAGGDGSLALGADASTSASCIALGAKAVADEAGVLAVGSAAYPVPSMRLGVGSRDAAPVDATVSPSFADGVDTVGATLTLEGGRGTGNADGGPVVLATSPAGGPGSAVNGTVPYAQLNSEGLFSVSADGSPANPALGSVQIRRNVTGSFEALSLWNSRGLSTNDSNFQVRIGAYGLTTPQQFGYIEFDPTGDHLGAGANLKADIAFATERDGAVSERMRLTSLGQLLLDPSGATSSAPDHTRVLVIGPPDDNAELEVQTNGAKSAAVRLSSNGNSSVIRSDDDGSFSIGSDVSATILSIAPGAPNRALDVDGAGVLSTRAGGASDIAVALDRYCQVYADESRPAQVAPDLGSPAAIQWGGTSADTHHVDTGFTESMDAIEIGEDGIYEVAWSIATRRNDASTGRYGTLINLQKAPAQTSNYSDVLGGACSTYNRIAAVGYDEGTGSLRLRVLAGEKVRVAWQKQVSPSGTEVIETVPGHSLLQIRLIRRV